MVFERFYFAGSHKFINNKEAAKAFQNLFLIAQQAGKKVDLNSYIKELIEAKSK